MNGWSTRFVTSRLDNFIQAGEHAVTTYAQEQYQEAADEAAEWWAGKVRASGRAPGKGMDDIDGRVTQPRRGGFFVRMGWLNGPPLAEDGKTTWFVYQDVGYDPFGMIRKGYNARRIPGLMLQLDARRMLQDGLYQANMRVVRRVNAAARRVR
jgi:hypothetical protein